MTGGAGSTSEPFDRVTLLPLGPIAVIFDRLSGNEQGCVPVFMIGTLQPSSAVAKPNVIVPTFNSAGKHVGSEETGTTVVVGIVAGMSIHGTPVDAAVLDVEVLGACVVDDNEFVEEVPQDDRIAANTRRASCRSVGFFLIFTEVYCCTAN